MELLDLVKTSDLFVYLNIQFRGFQFEEEEVTTTFIANIHQDSPYKTSHFSM